ncbi:family 3 encapsulin nanocompartment shell protein [Spirillospora sp. NPDC050679]
MSIDHAAQRVALADPVLDRRTPGEEFAWAVAGAPQGTDVVVPFRVALPQSFPLFVTRPRYAVRHLLKTATVPDRAVPYVHEAPPPGPAQAGTTYATVPEAGFTSSVRSAALTDLTVTVPLPKGLLDEPSLLAAFIDYRVLVRLSAVENEALLHGTPDGVIEGLLTLPQARRGSLAGDLGDALTTAAAEVETTGGSCDGMVVHPAVYWRLVREGLLGPLNAAGITVSRTRMIAADRVLLGDFKAAVTLLDPGVGSLVLHQGAGPDGADTVEARTRSGLAVHLPQHFVLLADD